MAKYVCSCRGEATGVFLLTPNAEPQIRLMSNRSAKPIEACMGTRPDRQHRCVGAI